MKTPEQVEEICKKLKPIIGEQADQLWHMYLTGDFNARNDALLDIEILAEKILKNETLAKQKILLEPPSETASTGTFFLGNTVYNNKKKNPLYLRHEDFIKQIGIFAVTGEGKTNLAYLLALQLLKHKIPFMIIDWKRSWRNLLSLKDKIPELKNVQIFTIGRNTLPLHWNPFRPPPNANKELWISNIAETLEKSHLSGPGVAYYFNKIYINLLKGLGDNFYPNFFDGIREIEKIKAYQRELKWKQTTLRIFQSFTTGSAIKAFNARNPVRLEHLLKKPLILELDLELPRPLRIFFSEIILKWIHLYRLSQGETDKLRHVLFLEEVHNLFNKSPYYQQESGSIENVYREIRAFGQGIVSITQHPSLLPIYLLGNCHTQIYLGLQHEDDIRAARKSLFLKRDEEAFPNMLNIGECIIKIKNRIEPCLAKTPLVPIQKRFITDDWLKTHNLNFLFQKYLCEKNNHAYLSLKNKINHILSRGDTLNSTEYPYPKNQNNQGVSGILFSQNNPNLHPKRLNHKHQKPQKHSDNISNENSKYPLDKKSIKLLEDIFLYPFSGVSQRYKRLEYSGYYGNNLKKTLISNKCILQRNIITDKYRLTLFDITKKGRIILADLGHDTRTTREGIVHKYWKEKIADNYRQKGFNVHVEKNINGRPDIIAEKDNKKITIEIETGKSDFIKNIQRNLKAGFDEVIVIATSKMAYEKINNELKKNIITDKKIKVISGFRFGLSP